jgi:DNA-binding beta-propeller fold protein YncE
VGLLLVLIGLLPVFVFGQDGDSDRLRALLKEAPRLPVERINLKVNPPLILEGISAVAADKRGTLYVLHRPVNGNPIVVLDPRGKFIRSWGNGMFTIPHGIRIDPAGHVWTVDANTSKIYKFTRTGKRLLTIDVGGVPDQTRNFCGATDIGFAGKGHIFVTDGYCNARIIEYDAAGKKVREWGKHGHAPSQFSVVHSIAVSRNGTLYIADRENGRLQRFNEGGELLGEWQYGGQFYAVALSRKGELYAAIHPKDVSLDREFHVVKIDLRNGKIVGKVEIRSHQLAVAPDGSLLPATRGSEVVLLKPLK